MLDDFNKAMDYIEEHILEDIDLEKVSKLAKCSSYHFQRMFSYMTNISIHEYIRRRRMSLAAVELQNHHKVLDIALKYGYESPTAFNRAFQSVHGFPPSYVKKKNVVIKSYPAIKFHLDISGHEELQYKIENKNAIKILGITLPLSKNLEENFKNIPLCWDQALQNKILEQLKLFMNGKPQGLLGVSIHHDENWRYMIAVSSDKQDEQFDEYMIPSSLWAIFKGEGTNISLQNLERKIILEWLPTSGYEYANIPDIEVYIRADPNDMIYEYWLPIQNKEVNND